MDTETKTKLIKMIEKAQSSWSGLDWTCDEEILIADLKSGAKTPDTQGQTVDEAIEETEEEMEEYRLEVEENAESASETADNAIAELESEDCDLQKVLVYLDDAVSIENEYGDCPSYGPPYIFLRDFLDK